MAHVRNRSDFITGRRQLRYADAARCPSLASIRTCAAASSKNRYGECRVQLGPSLHDSRHICRRFAMPELKDGCGRVAPARFEKSANVNWVARLTQAVSRTAARTGSQVNDDFGLTRRCDSLGAPNHLGTPDGQDKRLFGRRGPAQGSRSSTAEAFSRLDTSASRGGSSTRCPRSCCC